MCSLKTFYSKMWIHSALCICGYWGGGNGIRPFSIRDLSIGGFWFPLGSPETNLPRILRGTVVALTTVSTAQCRQNNH